MVMFEIVYRCNCLWTDICIDMHVNMYVNMFLLMNALKYQCDNITGGWICLFLNSNQRTVISILFSPDALTCPINLFIADLKHKAVNKFDGLKTRFDFHWCFCRINEHPWHTNDTPCGINPKVTFASINLDKNILRTVC